MLFFLAILLLTAVFTDWKGGKIPNLLIITGSIAGICMAEQPFQGILRILSVIIVFFPFYLVRALGAGDIKCIAMTSLYLTPGQLLRAILYTFLIAALMSVFKIIQVRSRRKEKVPLRCLTIHLAFPIFMGVLLSTGGDLLCIIS